MRGEGSPYGHDRVANVLVDSAAVSDHDRIDTSPDPLDQVRGTFGIHRFCDRREALQISEDNRDLPPTLDGLQLSQPVPQSTNSDVHDRVGQDTAQPLLSDDRSFQLSSVHTTPASGFFHTCARLIRPLPSPTSTMQRPVDDCRVAMA